MRRISTQNDKRVRRSTCTNHETSSGDNIIIKLFSSDVDEGLRGQSLIRWKFIPKTHVLFFKLSVEMRQVPVLEAT